MSDNAEEGIARIQAAAAKAQGTQGALEHQERSIANLNDRIVVFVFALACIGLFIVWTNTTSALVFYGSLAGVILLTLLWGAMRIKRLERTRQERQRQAAQWRSDSSE